MFAKLSRLGSILAIGASLAMTGCGGGGAGGGGVTSDPIGITITSAKSQIVPGESFEMTAVARTSNSTITSMMWSVTAPGNSPSLNLSETNCATIAIKDDKKASNNTESSVWTCKLSGQADTAFAGNTKYTLVATAIDNKAARISQSTDLQVTVPNTPSAQALTVLQDVSLVNVTEGQSVSLKATVNLPNASDPVTYTWRQLSGPQVTTVQKQSQLDFVAPATTTATTLDFRLTATSGSKSGSADFKVNVSSASTPFKLTPTDPLRTVSSGAPVTLNVTTDSANALTYAWSQTSGPTVAFVANGASFNFTAPVVTATTTLRFSVTGSVGGRSAKADFIVNVDGSSSSVMVSADQAIRTAAAGERITLTALGNQQGLNYAWRQLSGAQVQFVPNADKLEFTAPSQTTASVIEFEVTASQSAQSAKAKFVINVLPVSELSLTPSVPLVSVVSDSTVSLTATLNGANNQSVTYAFKQTAGPTQGGVVLTPGVNPRLDFRALTVTEPRTLTFELTATTAAAPIRTAKAVFNVEVTPLPALVITLSPAIQTVKGGDLVTLNASSNVTSGVTYRWSQLTGAGLCASLPLTDLGASATFRAPAATDLDQRCEHQVTATIGARSATAKVVTIVSKANPIIITVSKLLNVVAPGDVVRYSATTQSDPANPTYFRWEQVSGPTGAQALKINNIASPGQTDEAVTIQTPEGTASILRYTVRVYAAKQKVLAGGTNASSSIDIEIVSDPRLNLQVAAVKPALTVVKGSAVDLQAVASPDNGRVIFYRWKQVGTPPSTLTIGNITSANAGVVPQVVGTYVFEVAVDYNPIAVGGAGIARTQMVVTVTNPP